MRCIRCGTDSTRRQRVDGLCRKCRHSFAFEPTDDPYRITDPAFKKAVDRATSDAGIFFTERHLWHRLGARGSFRLGHPPTLPFSLFQEQHLPRWVAAHGSIPGLLPPREVAVKSLPRAVPADVAAFSFDRAVVTDRWETAAMLVANRFHFEHNCAVVSDDGYPDGIFETVVAMLRRNPRLTVYALHDASPAGCVLPLELRAPGWFPAPAVRIVDLGLRPAAARRLKLPDVRIGMAPHPPGLRQVLSPEEVRWLDLGRVGELAAFPPATLLRGVYRGIARAEAAGAAPVETQAGAVAWAGDLDAAPSAADTAFVDGFG